MATLKQSEKTLQLGKTLVHLFSDHGRTDLTSAWMAHYLAELIQEADAEPSFSKKRQLQKDCAATIMELWKKRKYYPGAIRPLEGVADVIPILKALLEPDDDDILSWHRYRQLESDTPWGHFIAKARDNMDEIIKICILAQISEESLQNEKKWLEHFDQLSENEQKLSKYLDSLINSPSYKEFEVTIQIAAQEKKIKKKKEKPEPPKDRRTLVFEKLEAILSEQAEALRVLKERTEAKKKRLS